MAGKDKFNQNSRPVAAAKRPTTHPKTGAGAITTTAQAILPALPPQ